jgi:hypothetical protein
MRCGLRIMSSIDICELLAIGEQMHKTMVEKIYCGCFYRICL